MTVAAVTMAYNESDFLPIWVRHYSAQVGARNCYVIDHGSDDGSTEGLGEVNVVRIPRSPQDDERRAGFMSTFCASLLLWHDWVLHTDADEMVFVDPARYPSLLAYCALSPHAVVTTYGFNVVHSHGEPAFDPARPVLRQRKWMQFWGAMAKPALIRRPVAWTGGFHRTDAAPVFDDLYMLHLRWFDRGIGLRRLARTREQPWADPAAAWWQRVSDEECEKMFDRSAALVARDEVRLGRDSPDLNAAVAALLGPSGGRPGAPDTFNINYEVHARWPVPKRFRSIF
ncbi:MAG: glycosyltransferase family 2 protein [Alphaproteobacteria bacterium]|nr:glycosyltransferase family 2 protein [Alphaproteobacteria bacterium]